MTVKSVKAALDFHRVVIKSSGNQSLMSTLEMILNKLSLFRRKLNLIPENRSALGKEEKDIFKALKDRNGKKAADLMRQHVLGGKKRVSEYLSNAKQ